MSDTYVNVSRVDGMGMLTLRADLADAAVKKAVKSATKTAVPATMKVDTDGAAGNAWMSPDELMVFCADADRADVLAKLEKGLAETHHLLVDVSDARAVFDLEGDAVREVLAKLTPTDVMGLQVGDFRRTRFGQVAGAFWLSSETTAHIICFRSVGDYMHRMLERSAQVGAEVSA